MKYFPLSNVLLQNEHYFLDLHIMVFQRLSFILLATASITLASCSNAFDPISDGDNVTYMGTFFRGGPLIDPSPANVTLRFKDGKFEGTSSETNYPAICNGTYKVKGSTISFLNECFFPANFDWSFIVAGDFEYELKGDSLKMRRSYEGGNYDQYMLKKAG
jgi:hypothetical protein